MLKITKFTGLCSCRPPVSAHLIRSFTLLKSTPPNTTKPPPGVRNFFNFTKSLFKRRKEQDFKMADNVPDEFILIYRTQMTKYIVPTQLMMVIGVASLTYALIVSDDYGSLAEKYDEMFKTKTRAVENEEMYFLASLIVIVVLAHVVIMMLPIRIYKHPGKSRYHFFMHGGFPGTKKRVIADRGQVIYTPGSDLLPWGRDKYTIQTERDMKKVILLQNGFRRPADLSILIGEQKDPDVK